MGFGGRKVVICDAKASTHFYGRETYGYVQTALSRTFIENLVGGVFFWGGRVLIFGDFFFSLGEVYFGLKGIVINGQYSTVHYIY